MGKKRKNPGGEGGGEKIERITVKNRKGLIGKEMQSLLTKCNKKKVFRRKKKNESSDEQL